MDLSAIFTIKCIFLDEGGWLDEDILLALWSLIWFLLLGCPSGRVFNSFLFGVVAAHYLYF